MVRDVGLHGSFELWDRSKNASADAVLGDVPEKTFHHIEPRGTGGREVDMDPRVLLQPGFDRRVLMGGVIVADDLQGELLRRLTVQPLKEFQPLFVAMPRHRLGNLRPIQRVQGCEQCGCPVPLVVVGHRAAAALLQRKPRLASVQGLDLRLLIDTQDDGVIWRIQIQAHDFHQLLFKMGIITDLETHDTMRFEAVLFPDATHRAFTHACGPCHRSPAPVRRILRFFLYGLLDNFLALCGNHPGLTATPSPFLFDSSKPRSLPVLDAFPRRLEIAVQGQADVPEGFTVGTAKNDFRSEDFSRRQFPATR